jgi:acyl dehydratase
VSILGPTVLDGPRAVRAAVGTHLGHSPWLLLTTEHVAGFRRATGDPDATFLPLALSNHFLPQIVEVTGFSAGINYGTGAVALGPRIDTDDRVRGAVRLVAADELPGGLQTTMLVTVEIDGRDEPACTIESLSRWLT